MSNVIREPGERFDGPEDRYADPTPAESSGGEPSKSAESEKSRSSSAQLSDFADDYENEHSLGGANGTKKGPTSCKSQRFIPNVENFSHQGKRLIKSTQSVNAYELTDLHMSFDFQILQLSGDDFSSHDSSDDDEDDEEEAASASCSSPVYT